jgi:hypothetical protein
MLTMSTTTAFVLTGLVIFTLSLRPRRQTELITMLARETAIAIARVPGAS